MSAFPDDPSHDAAAIPKTALWLGLSGVIPFIAGGVLVLFNGLGFTEEDFARLFLMTYGAVILSFLGGVRWGLALADNDKTVQAKDQKLSVIASLIGWLALLLPFGYGLLLLIAGFVIQGGWDIVTIEKSSGPAWYGKLRAILTGIVSVILMLVWVVKVLVA